MSAGAELVTLDEPPGATASESGKWSTCVTWTENLVVSLALVIAYNRVLGMVSGQHDLQ